MAKKDGMSRPALHLEDTAMSILHHVSDFFSRRLAYARARKDLMALDDHLLRDIGITRDQIDAVARRSLEQPEDAALAGAEVHRPVFGTGRRAAAGA